MIKLGSQSFFSSSSLAEENSKHVNHSWIIRNTSELKIFWFNVIRHSFTPIFAAFPDIRIHISAALGKKFDPIYTLGLLPVHPFDPRRHVVKFFFLFDFRKACFVSWASRTITAFTNFFLIHDLKIYFFNCFL